MTTTNYYDSTGLRNYICNSIHSAVNLYYYRYAISQANIVDGVYKITRPGYYYLTEDIAFDIPGGDINKYVLTLDKKSEHLYGNHAGIIIESDNVILDLAGYSLYQTPRFYAVQRFFNLVQLNNFPFMLDPKKSCTETSTGKQCPVVGPIPHVRLPYFKEPQFVIIKNGAMGLTSHTGIHGNNNKFILVDDIQFSDFEVSAMTFNNLDNSIIENIIVHKSLQKVPFNPFWVTVTLGYKTLLKEGVPLEELNVLSTAIEKMLMKIKIAYTIDDLLIIAREFPDFSNEDRKWLSPCGQFGISITKRGPSIHDFSSGTDNSTDTSRVVYIQNTTIKDMAVNVFEDISIAKGGKPVGLIAGSVVRTATMDNPLTREILNILKTIPITKRKVISGLTDEMIDAIQNPSLSTPLELCRGIDNMGHISKGLIGIRLDSCVHAYLNGVRIHNLRNIGDALTQTEIDIAKQRYFSPSIIMMDSGLISSRTFVGSNSCAFIASAGNLVHIFNSSACDIVSTNGMGIAVALNNKLKSAIVHGIQINNVSSNSKINDSTTLLIDKSCENVRVERVFYN